MGADVVFPPGALKVAGGARGALALFPIPFFQIGKFTRFARKLTKTHILFRMRPILLPLKKICIRTCICFTLCLHHIFQKLNLICGLCYWVIIWIHHYTRILLLWIMIFSRSVEGVGWQRTEPPSANLSRNKLTQSSFILFLNIYIYIFFLVLHISLFFSFLPYLSVFVVSSNYPYFSFFSFLIFHFFFSVISLMWFFHCKTRYQVFLRIVFWNFVSNCLFLCLGLTLVIFFYIFDICLNLENVHIGS